MTFNSVVGLKPSEIKAEDVDEALTKRFRPGVHRHYKGGLYLALFLTEDSNNGPNGEESTQEPEVVYVHLEGPKAGQRCNRKLEQWNELVEVTDVRNAEKPMKVPRFAWVRP